MGGSLRRPMPGPSPIGLWRPHNSRRPTDDACRARTAPWPKTARTGVGTRSVSSRHTKPLQPGAGTPGGQRPLRDGLLLNVAIDLEPIGMFVEEGEDLGPAEPVFAEMVIDPPHELVILRRVDGPTMG